MGAWGTALYSDDLAADIRTELRDLLAEGLPPDSALETLLARYPAVRGDPDEGPVFWLAVADTAWRLGRGLERATREALKVVDSGADLERWPEAPERRKRARVLGELAERLRAPPPAPVRLRKRVIAANAWQVGEVVSFRLRSGRLALFRVIGHHVDRGGRSAVCEPLDWTGTVVPEAQAVARLRVRARTASQSAPQFLLGEPRRKSEAARLARTGILSSPMQRTAEFIALVFPYIDMQLAESFGLE